MRPEVELKVMATGSWFKLHRCLCSLYAVTLPVEVIITGCGDSDADNELVSVCIDHQVGSMLRKWSTIMEGVSYILSKSGAKVVILCHDDVVFPPCPMRYIEEIAHPILKSPDVAIVGGKVWDAFYGKLNAHGADGFPGEVQYPVEPMAVSCVHSSCMAIRPEVSQFANLKAEFDFERVLSYGAWLNSFATLYWPTSRVLWHEKGGTVDYYHQYPLLASYILDITRRTSVGTGFDEKWIIAYGETPRESLDKMGEMAAAWAGTQMERFRRTARGVVYGSKVAE